jgi:hypothetical protein
MDKSATILEAQWMEKEIPRIKEELSALKTLEQELLTTPLETVSSAYQETYRAKQERAHPFYNRRRSVKPTRYGYRERMVEAGWIAIGFKVLMVIITALAVYVAYHNHQTGHSQQGIVWGSVLLVVGIALSFAPMVGSFFWERRARQSAERAASEARHSEAFLAEKQERQARLQQCQGRIAELDERLRSARLRYDELRRILTKGNHRGETAG